MRKLIVGLLLGACLLPRPARAHEHTQGGEFGLALAAAGANILYLPAKAIVATGGLFLGSITGVLTGGDAEAAYAVWVPAAGGTFFLTPQHVDGTVPIEFFGSDYADRPSTVRSYTDRNVAYDALYTR